jgi:2-polyprenyl-6-methoxyphenol hydroxylase-like FAD-dependent oxidoreductase
LVEGSVNATRPQVLIVGAGPTGLVMAIELRRRHIDCRIIERRAGPAHTSRAITTHARTLEILEDMGIVERFLHGGVRNDGYIFNFLGSEHKPRLDYTRLPTRYPFVCMFNQNETEKILRDHLEHELGLPIEWCTELTSISEDANGTVTANLTHKEGELARTNTVHPRWVVACDGIHSPTREQLGIPYSGSEYDLVMQMVDTVLEGFTGTDHLLHYHMSEDTFLMIGKLEGPNHRVLVSAQGDPEAIEQQDLVTPIVKLHLPHVSMGPPAWKTTWVIWIRKAARFQQGHVFLCGEAGHVHSVAGGQGWNVSLQDAYNLAWKLALVIRGRARESLLDTYQREREPVADQVIEGSSAIHEVILAHGSGLAERMALTAAPDWNDRAVARIAGLSYNYREQIDVPPGTPATPAPVIGDRLPDVALSAHLRLHQVIAHTRYTLLMVLTTLDDAHVDAARATRERMHALYPDCLRCELIAPRVPYPWPGVLPLEDRAGAVAAAFGVSAAGELILVRPDGYVGYRCALGELGKLEQALALHLIAAA